MPQKGGARSTDKATAKVTPGKKGAPGKKAQKTPTKRKTKDAGHSSSPEEPQVKQPKVQGDQEQTSNSGGVRPSGEQHQQSQGNSLKAGTEADPAKVKTDEVSSPHDTCTEPVKQEEKPGKDTLAAGEIEEGKIFFLYRPKVGTEEPESLDDVQRFYIIMQPTSRPNAKARLLVVPKKRLPGVVHHDRLFTYISAVSTDVAKLVSGLGPSTYETKTRGTRHQPAARAAAEGFYTLAMPEGGQGHSRSARQTRLAYKLELPLEPGEVQEELGIDKEGAFVLSVKNPDRKAEGTPSAGPEPQYTEAQRRHFQSYAWIGAEDYSLLDVIGTELLLVGASDSVKGELGKDTEQSLEAHKQADVAQAMEAPGASKDPQGALLERFKHDLTPEGLSSEAAKTAGAGVQGGHQNEITPLPTEPAETGKWM